MTEAILKEEDGSLVPGVQTEGTTTADQISTQDHKIQCPASPFEPVGSLEMEQGSLRITYESFKQTRVVYIGKRDLARLLHNELEGPAPVHEVIRNPDGSEIYQKIGHAHRSISGNAFMIATTTSGGDLSAPWLAVMKVIGGRKKSCRISRVRDKMSPAQQSQTAPARDVYAGLDRGF